MFKAILAGIILPGMALLISMSAPAFAESHPQARSHIQRHSSHQSNHHRRHHVRHAPRHRRQTRHHRRHGHFHGRRHGHRHGHRHGYRHRNRHPGVHVDIRIGGHHQRPTYRHGHPRHVHNTDCPIVIPTWEVHYRSHHHGSSAAILHIVLASFGGDLYIDGEYYGKTHRFDDSRLKLPVSPGLHTVQLRFGGRAYTQKVHVQRGATAVVKANRL